MPITTPSVGLNFSNLNTLVFSYIRDEEEPGYLDLPDTDSDDTDSAYEHDIRLEHDMAGFDSQLIVCNINEIPIIQRVFLPTLESITILGMHRDHYKSMLRKVATTCTNLRFFRFREMFDDDDANDLITSADINKWTGGSWFGRFKTLPKLQTLDIHALGSKALVAILESFATSPKLENLWLQTIQNGLDCRSYVDDGLSEYSNLQEPRL
jgi:hypothetical protein